MAETGAAAAVETAPERKRLFFLWLDFASHLFRQ